MVFWGCGKFFLMQTDNKKNNGMPLPRFTTTILLVIILLLLFNFNFDVFNTRAAIGPIYGEGTPGFLVRWVVPASAPTVSNMVVTVNNSNYCSVGIHATVTWIYSDSNGLPQIAYEVQIDDDLDPLSGGPEWESGTVAGSGTSASTILCNAANPITSPQIACRMTWSTVYRAWARVQNSAGVWSSWTLMSTYCNGASCSPPNPWPNGIPNSWTTPVHAFPNVSFTSSPPNPSVGSPVTFTDTTVFYGAATPRTWLWDFNYPSGPTQTITAPPAANGNTTYTYTANGTYSPRLRSTDDLGQSCFYDPLPEICIQPPLPRWREIIPR